MAKEINEIILPKEEMPKNYYNILADMGSRMAPPKGDLGILPKIFAPSLLKQEMSCERYIKIPEEVREIYRKIGRPTPLYRAKNLEKKLKTPAKIFYKREDVSFTGSHKINTAIAQAYFIAKDGFKKITTETGAGQWGSALALGARLFDLDLTVYMVKCSFEQKPYRKFVMKMYNANVVSSPSNTTECGRRILKENPNHSGTLGIAISEAIEVAKNNEDTVYSLGSVLNHVLMHQTIIGQETMKQFESIDSYPDIIIGCVGGGSNFAGISFPFLGEKLSGKPRAKNIRAIGVEPKEVPSMTKGEFRYDYGDEAGQTPLLKMYTLGHKFVPEPIYAGGLRYHGDAPIVSQLVADKTIEAEAYSQQECFESAKLFAETEGLIIAPESSHALQSAIHHALEAKSRNEEKTIVFNMSGHGLLDLASYASVLGFK